MGAKLKDVTALLGEGTVESSSEVGGVKATVYSWNGDGISNMNVTIENNIVTGKAQAGLKEMDAKVTLDKFNKIKTGMKYDQVKALLGTRLPISISPITLVAQLNSSASFFWVISFSFLFSLNLSPIVNIITSFNYIVRYIKR